MSLIYGEASITADLAAQTVTLSANGNTHVSSVSIAAGTPYTLSMVILPSYVSNYIDSLVEFTGSTSSANPSVGVYTNVAGATFGAVYGYNPAVRSNLWGRWSTASAPDASAAGWLSMPGLYGGEDDRESPVLLKNLTLQKFQVDFQASTIAGTQFAFDARDDYNWKSLVLNPFGDIFGYKFINGAPTLITGDYNGDNVPSSPTELWVRVVSDGSSITVTEAGSQAGLDTTDPCFTSSDFGITGGQLGFADDTSGASGQRHDQELQHGHIQL